MGEDEKKLFVGKLPQDIHEDEIRMIFNTYGPTADVHLMNVEKQQPGQDRCAFVTYETAEAAKVAIQVLNGVYKFREDAKEPINVGVAIRRNKGDKGGCKGGGKGDYGRGPPMGYDRGPPMGYDRGYDRGPPPGMGKGGYDRGYDRGPPPDFDRGFKGGYDRGMPPRGYDRGPPPGYGGGYDRGYDRGPPPRDDMGPPRRPQAQPGTKIYVGNLPSDITKDAIDMVFGTYGRVSDIHIMNGRAKNGQSCAFVVFGSPTEAKTAMAAIATGYEIRPGEGNIYVKYADENQKGEKGGRPRPY